MENIGWNLDHKRLRLSGKSHMNAEGLRVEKQGTQGERAEGANALTSWRRTRTAVSQSLNLNVPIADKDRLEGF